MLKEWLHNQLSGQRQWLHFSGRLENNILISSMGRSGSTWVSQIINYKNNYREIFEPFLPSRVREAADFNYCMYLEPSCEDIHLKKAAKKILTGKLTNPWTDERNTSVFSSKQLIKDIRTNLMIGWLSSAFPNLKIILLIRNPIAVVRSYKSLGWGKHPDKPISEIDLICSQQKLLNDYPVIKKALRKYNKEDYFTSLVLTWAILYYVPIQQNKGNNKFYLLKYEDMLNSQSQTIDSLFQYLNIQREDEKLNSVIKRPSKTAYNKKEFKTNDMALSQEEMKILYDILAYFDLAEIYKIT